MRFKRIGCYDVTALIGEGGMGQVYDVTALIGEGGMGQVYQARQYSPHFA